MIVFYDCNMAPSPRRARILLAEKNVPHETVEVDIMKNAQMADSFRAINPNCTLPAIKLEDGAVLTDNAGIAIYLEEKFPTPPMMGETPLDKAEIATWNAMTEFEFALSVAHALRNNNPYMQGRALPGPYDYDQIPALAERGLQQIDNFLMRLERRLENRDFIAADQFSIADVTAAVTLDFARIVKKKPTDDHPNIKRWCAALNERPSFKL